MSLCMNEKTEILIKKKENNTQVNFVLELNISNNHFSLSVLMNDTN